MNLGGAEVIVIVIVALIVFGPKRLPEIGRQIGAAMRELRNVEHRVKSEISQALDLDTLTTTTPDHESAPFYGDPTNVPDQPEPERERIGLVDDHDQPPPITIDDEPEYTGEPQPDPSAEESADEADGQPRAS